MSPPFDLSPCVVQKLKQSGAKAILIVPNWPKQTWFEEIMGISIEIVELPHKGVKLYCEDNCNPLPQCSWSTLACLVDGNLGDYWQDAGEMGTEEVVSNSSISDKIEVDRDDRERKENKQPSGERLYPFQFVPIRQKSSQKCQDFKQE